MKRTERECEVRKRSEIEARKGVRRIGSKKKRIRGGVETLKSP